VLEEAAQARLIEQQEGVGQYRFSHALVQETLYGELSTARRVRLHGQIGDAIEQAQAANLTPYLGELAQHYFEAAADGRADKAIEYALRAAEQAMRQYAWEEAVAQYGRALQVLELLPTPDPLRKCEVLLAKGDAESLIGSGSGDVPQARATFRQAAELARRAGSAEHLARAAIGMGGPNPLWPFESESRIAHLEEALAALPSGDNRLRVELLVQLGVLLYSSIWTFSRTASNLDAVETGLARALELMRDAIAMARRLDASTTLLALAAYERATSDSLNPAEHLANLQEMRELASQTDNPLMLTEAVEGLHFMYLALGDPGGAARALNDFAERARQLRHPHKTWRVVAARAMYALIDGRFAEAEEFVSEAHAAAGTWTATYFQQTHALRREQGRSADAWDLVRSAAHMYSAWPDTDLYAAVHAADINDAEQARFHLDRIVIEKVIAPHMLFTDSGCCCAILTEVVVRYGTSDEARLLYDAFHPFHDRYIVENPWSIFYGSVSHYLGLLATFLRQWDAAEQHFADALEAHRRVGARPYAAWTQHAWAAMLIERAEPPDRERALTMVDQALAEAESMGMSRLSEQALALKVRVQGILKA
jgi:tetratricopeptide (TPR) repeat protein